MTVRIRISEQTQAQLAAAAAASGISLEDYLQRLLEQEASARKRVAAPLEAPYGVLAAYGAAPSTEVIEANRTELFGVFFGVN